MDVSGCSKCDGAPRLPLSVYRLLFDDAPDENGLFFRFVCAACDSEEWRALPPEVRTDQVSVAGTLTVALT